MLDQLVSLVVPPCCAACRAPGLKAGDALCLACRCPAAAAAFERAWAAMAYEGVARQAVRALKFARARALVDVMAAQIVACAPTALLVDRTIVAVPAHPSRLRSRGFDPAGLLAAAIARRSGLALQPALRRERTAARQLGASRDERRDRQRLGFVATQTAPARAVLIDDVHTTGATLDACAAALRHAGSESVVAISWARTLDVRLH